MKNIGLYIKAALLFGITSLSIGIAVPMILKNNSYIKNEHHTVARVTLPIEFDNQNFMKLQKVEAKDFHADENRNYIISLNSGEWNKDVLSDVIKCIKIPEHEVYSTKYFWKNGFDGSKKTNELEVNLFNDSKSVSFNFKFLKKTKIITSSSEFLEYLVKTSIADSKFFKEYDFDIVVSLPANDNKVWFKEWSGNIWNSLKLRHITYMNMDMKNVNISNISWFFWYATFDNVKNLNMLGHTVRGATFKNLDISNIQFPPDDYEFADAVFENVIGLQKVIDRFLVKNNHVIGYGHFINIKEPLDFTNTYVANATFTNMDMSLITVRDGGWSFNSTVFNNVINLDLTNKVFGSAKFNNVNGGIGGDTSHIPGAPNYKGHI